MHSEIDLLSGPSKHHLMRLVYLAVGKGEGNS